MGRQHRLVSTPFFCRTIALGFAFVLAGPGSLADGGSGANGLPVLTPPPRPESLRSVGYCSCLPVYPSHYTRSLTPLSKAEIHARTLEFVNTGKVATRAFYTMCLEGAVLRANASGPYVTLTSPERACYPVVQEGKVLRGKITAVYQANSAAGRRQTLFAIQGRLRALQASSEPQVGKKN